MKLAAASTSTQKSEKSLLYWEVKRMNDAKISQLSDWLSEWERDSVEIEQVQAHSLGELTLFIVDMKVTRSSTDSEGRRSSRTFRQTGVVYFDQRFDLPWFSVSPTIQGITGRLFAWLGMPDVNFEDSPTFSQQFQVVAHVEPTVRALLTREIRQHLESTAQLSIGGYRKHLMIYRREHVCGPSERDELVSEAVRVIELFWRAHDELDRRPDLHREAAPNDALAFAENMGGFAGQLLKQRLMQLKLTRESLEHFLQLPAPRKIPAGMVKQLRGQSAVFVFMGAFFVFGGSFILAMTLGLPGSIPTWAGVPGGALMVMLGIVIATAALSYRSRINRTLHRGMIEKGIITQVDRSDVKVNDEWRYLVKLKLDSGSELSVAVYGDAGRRAQRIKESGQRVRVLLDPNNPRFGICVDLLLIWET